MTLTAALHDEALVLLQSLSGPHGIHASSTATTNYGAVFARDAVMAGIAGLLLDDSTVTTGLTRTLERLRELQGAEGQIPSNYQIFDLGAPRVSFGSLAPRLDAPLWYLIGVGVAVRAGAVAAEPFRQSAAAVVRLFDALEYNGQHLFYVPVGGDWADEWIYDGFVLHDQLLRAWALRLAAVTFDEPSWRAKADLIEQAMMRRFWSPDHAARGFPLAAWSPARTHDLFDLATTSLLALSGIAPEIGSASLHFIAERFLSRGQLPPAFHPVIEPGHADWPALQRYHLHGFRNHPHEYHNGGVWPIWLGWLALALAREGRRADLDALGDALAARLSQAAPYRFTEFFHGVTGAAGGTAGMAYSATGLLFLGVAATPDRLSLLAT